MLLGFSFRPPPLAVGSSIADGGGGGGEQHALMPPTSWRSTMRHMHTNPPRRIGSSRAPGQPSSRIALISPSMVFWKS
jgi:hypothetical protein